MIVSVNVGFLCTPILQFVGVLWMVDVKEVYLVVGLTFHCEFECRVYCVVVCQYVLGVCVVGVIDDQYVVNISEVFYDLIFV